MLVIGSAPLAVLVAAAARLDDADVDEATEDWDDDDGIDWLRC